MADDCMKAVFSESAAILNYLSEKYHKGYYFQNVCIMNQRVELHVLKDCSDAMNLSITFPIIKWKKLLVFSLP